MKKNGGFMVMKKMEVLAHKTIGMFCDIHASLPSGKLTVFCGLEKITLSFRKSLRCKISAIVNSYVQLPEGV